MKSVGAKLLQLYIIFMRKESFATGDFIHVFNRGNRKMPIIHNDTDKWRFLKILRFLNDQYSLSNIFREIDILVKNGKCRQFERPNAWPQHKPLVKILSFCLMPNHYHLLLKEIIDGGVSRFMHKLSTSFTNYSNIKYNEVGSVFQGSYKAKLIKTERYLQYVDVYIQVFNPFELYAGGSEKATKEFDKAFDFTLEYPFCSLGESFCKRKLNIIDRDILSDGFEELQGYKDLARELIIYHNIRKTLKEYTFD